MQNLAILLVKKIGNDRDSCHMRCMMDSTFIFSHVSNPKTGPTRAFISMTNNPVAQIIRNNLLPP